MPQPHDERREAELEEADRRQSARRFRRATYITLLRFTPQGIQTIKEAPARIDRGRETLRALGSDLNQIYLVMGRYDVVAISEAPDDETAAKDALAIAPQGNVATEPLRAFTEEEYRNIVAALP